MAEEQQDFAQEPPLTDGEVKLLRLLLQRVASPDFDFGFLRAKDRRPRGLWSKGGLRVKESTFDPSGL